VLIETDAGPLRLLNTLKAIERRLGRTPAERYGPRELDLDLLTYGPLRYRHVADGRTVLVVPHPRTPERRFVLQPLFDIAPDMELPGLGAVSSLLFATEAQLESVRLFDDAVLSLPGTRL
jgi:7,8-dihydro-6-hydroxymethylpterin-pyrophosphokinase